MYDAVEIIVEIMVVPDGCMIVPSAGDGFMRTRVTLAYRERQVGSRANRNHRWRGDLAETERVTDPNVSILAVRTGRRVGAAAAAPRARGVPGRGGAGLLRSALRLPRAP